MKSIQELLSLNRDSSEFLKKPPRSSERSEIIKQFYEALLLENRIENYRKWKRTNLTAEEFKKTDKYRKPTTARAIAIKLSHIKSKQDLYYFLSICKDYKTRKGSFGKIFWGALKKR